MDDRNLPFNLGRNQFGPGDIPLEGITERLMALRDRIMTDVDAGQLDPSQIRELLENLPRLTEQDLIALGHQESLCSICLNPYLAILAEEEIALAMDSPALPIEDLGITRLSRPWQCGHVFCRRDISKWIQEAHDSCPMCRRLLIEPNSSNPEPRDARTDSSGPLTELERQIQEFITILRSRIDDTGLSGVQNAVLPEDVHDRTGFSGMYS